MKRILVIEDNPTNLKLATTILAKAGYDVAQAFDAPSGIARAHELRPDLILMDVQLPGMDGLAATRELKQHPQTRAIPVIALTAFAMKGDEQKMLAAGCDGYIAKPIRYHDFLARIEAALAGNDVPNPAMQGDTP
jgi:two-component system cell cycle response regulator DivK